MRGHNAVLLTAAALAVLAAPRARADSGWSGAAHLGLVFTQEQGTSASSGGWVNLLHTLMPSTSAGIEAGYLKLPKTSGGAIAWIRYAGPAAESLDMYSASAAVKIRGAGPASAHMIGTFGYYHIAGLHDHRLLAGGNHAVQEWNPGFSLGLGFSGAGFVRPSFQLRWHEMIGPEGTNLDVVTFEVGAHFD